MIDNKTLKTVYKCWFFIHKEEPSYSGYIYGETFSKAKYQFYRDTDGYDFIEFFKHYRFSREPNMDMREPVPMDLIANLNKKQIDIISHANGNEQKTPGTRCYYNLCDKDDKDMAVLVDLKLMNEPLKCAGGKSYTWILTELGSAVAMSLLPIVSCDIESTLKERELLLSWAYAKEIILDDSGMMSMRMFKINPRLLGLVKDMRVHIWSGEWGSYWRENCRGYTNKESDAGVYGIREAFLSTKHCGKEKWISFKAVA